MIRALGVRETCDEEHREELLGRLVIADAELGRIDKIRRRLDQRRDDRTRPQRLRVPPPALQVQAGKLEDEDGIEERSVQHQHLMHRIYDAQREVLVGLRDEGEVSSEVTRLRERELDLEESRLEV